MYEVLIGARGSCSCHNYFCRSFHALDTEGNIWVWGENTEREYLLLFLNKFFAGTLNGTTGVLNSDGFSEAGKPAPQPLRLEMPSRIKDIRQDVSFLQ
jgi:SCF-associated factor 1